MKVTTAKLSSESLLKHSYALKKIYYYAWNASQHYVKISYLTVPVRNLRLIYGS